MRFETTQIRQIGVFAYNLRFSTDGKLWFTSLSEDSVLSYDIVTSRLQTHFSDALFCTFCFDGKRGAIGTMDGRVLSFTSDSPVLHPLATASERTAVGAIDIDQRHRSVFFACGSSAYRVSFDGRLLGQWQYNTEPFTIRFADNRDQLWLACDGLEVIDLSTGSSTVWGENRLCPYVDIEIAPDGRVACFGGDIDVFTPDGELLSSVSGGYNRGIFDSKGRLFAREVTMEVPDHVTIRDRHTSMGEISIISSCDSFAMASTEDLIVASHRGMLYFLARR